MLALVVLATTARAVPATASEVLQLWQFSDGLWSRATGMIDDNRKCVFVTHGLQPPGKDGEPQRNTFNFTADYPDIPGFQPEMVPQEWIADWQFFLLSWEPFASFPVPYFQEVESTIWAPGIQRRTAIFRTGRAAPVRHDYYDAPLAELVAAAIAAVIPADFAHEVRLVGHSLGASLMASAMNTLCQLRTCSESPHRLALLDPVTTALVQPLLRDADGHSESIPRHLAAILRRLHYRGVATEIYSSSMLGYCAGAMTPPLQLYRAAAAKSRVTVGTWGNASDADCLAAIRHPVRTMQQVVCQHIHALYWYLRSWQNPPRLCAALGADGCASYATTPALSAAAETALVHFWGTPMPEQLCFFHNSAYVRIPEPGFHEFILRPCSSLIPGY